MKKRRILVAVALLAVSGGIAWWIVRDDGEGPPAWIQASGTVEATDARVGFQVPGRIVSLVPREGDDVSAGEELARLDSQELRARRREAEARAEATRAELEELERGFRSEEIAQARSALTAARETLSDAERDLERTRTLHAGKAVPREALDKAEVARTLAATEVERRTEQLRLLERGPREERIRALWSRLEAARAAVESVEAALEERTLRAPFDGRVTVRHREPGEVVAPGSPVLTLLDRDDRWVRIYVREDRIGAVHLGLPATIRSDTYPDERYPGEVFFVASEAEFTPKNVQTQEERVRLVYAVKVRVVEDPSYELKPGMPVDVELELGSRGGEAFEKEGLEGEALEEGSSAAGPPEEDPDGDEDRSPPRESEET